MREVLMNEKTNLLQLEEHFYQLVDVDEPNTFRNLFPYSEVPKIAFNDRIVPHNMPEDIWITDTTFRDGQQSRAPYTTEQIVTIYDYLSILSEIFCTGSKYRSCKGIASKNTENKNDISIQLSDVIFCEIKSQENLKNFRWTNIGL